MSDEKLSEGLERELQRVARDAMWAGFPATACAAIRPLLARLERERDAAENTGFAAGVKAVNDGNIMPPKAAFVRKGCAGYQCCACDAEHTDFHLNMRGVNHPICQKCWEEIVRDITSLAPSVVSQPSREREVLARIQRLVDAWASVDISTAQFFVDIQEVLTATPASTGGEK